MAPGDLCRVFRPCLALYSNPNPSTKEQLGTVPGDSILVVLDPPPENGYQSFTKVLTHDGRVGWVMKEGFEVICEDR